MLIWSIYQCKNGYIVSDKPFGITNYDKAIPNCHIACTISELLALLGTLEGERNGIEVTWKERTQQ